MQIEKMKKTKRKKEERKKEKEAEIEKVDIKDIRNRELIPDQIRIHLEDQDPDRDQGPIIEMAASPPTIPKYSEEKKGKVLL